MNYAWQQPVKNLATWASRGVSGIVLPSVANVQAWPAWLAEAQRLKMAFVAGSDETQPVLDHPLCTGVLLLPDEPNSGNPGDPGFRSPGAVLDASITARKRTKKQLWLSLSGWNLQYQTDDLVRGYCQAADVINFDYYIINRGEGPAAIPKLTQIIERLRVLSGGKTIVCDIECSNQHIPAGVIPPPVAGESYRGPTVNEMIAEVRAARPTAQVLYFSHDSGPPWKDWDTTPPDLSGAMTALNL